MPSKKKPAAAKKTAAKKKTTSEKRSKIVIEDLTAKDDVKGGATATSRMADSVYTCRAEVISSQITVYPLKSS